MGVYGGANINTQHIELQNGADILVATPGRLFDLAMKGSFKIKNIKKLIIDEVDEMLNFGFRTQLQNIMELMPERRQNMMFSATMIPEVEELIALYFNNPVYVEAAPTGTPLENISQQAYLVPNFNTKVNFIKSLLADKNTFEKVLIFVGTKRMADNLYDELFPLFEGEFGVIHSNKEQNHRFNTVKEFENGNYRFIIATDIVARGIDIAEVSHVINFDTPEVPENYIHRIGRTGRAEKKGISITFFTPKEEKFLEMIEALMSFKIPKFDLPESIEISSILIEDEKPKVFMKLPPLPPLKREDAGPAFHEKSAKNSKKNIVVRHKDKMLLKYGKPKKRGKKK
jgi:ATP-dependent RNA helicase RhlE